MSKTSKHELEVLQLHWSPFSFLFDPLLLHIFFILTALDKRKQIQVQGNRDNKQVVNSLLSRRSAFLWWPWSWLAEVKVIIAVKVGQHCRLNICIYIGSADNFSICQHCKH